METVLLGAQMLLGAALAWSCFCRLVRTDADTKREIRWAICFEAGSALLVMGAPVLPILMDNNWWPPLTTPWWTWLALLAAAAAVQVVTATHWRYGVPLSFQEKAQ